MLIDPLASKGYHRQPAWENADVLRAVVTTLRRDLNQPIGKLDRLLAVTLTKCDVAGVFDPDAPPHQNRFPPQGRSYLPRLAHDLGKQVARHMQEDMGMSELVALARQSFTQVEFFAVSALGQPPVPDESTGELRLLNPKPRRVEEPLLWILNRWGYI